MTKIQIQFFFSALTVASLLLTGPTTVDAQQHYFRSDNGLAKDDSVALPSDFGDEAALVWKAELAPGHSSPCVFGDYIFITTYEDDQLATIGLSRQSGKLLWKQLTKVKDIEKYHPVGSPAAATIACDGERVYSFFGSFGMQCYSLDGEVIWSKPMAPYRNEFGSGGSPIVKDGRVFLIQDHDIDSFVIAIDAKTGKTIWKAERELATRSYSTPSLRKTTDGDELLVAGALRLTAYDVKTGKEKWWVDGLARIVNTTASVVGDMVFIATWSPGGDLGERISMEPWDDATKTYDKDSNGKIVRAELPDDSPVLNRFFRIDLNQDKGLDKYEWERHARVFELARNAIFAIKPTGSGDLTNSCIQWEYERGIPYVASPLTYRGVIYMAKDGGIATLVNAKNGKLHEQGRLSGRGNYYASPVAGDGKIYFASERGVITVIEAGTEFNVIDSYDFGSRIYGTPVIDDGQLLIRTNDALYCYRKP